MLNDFLDSREEFRVVRTDSGTTSFPLLMKGRVDDLCTLLHEKYDTAFVPGRFFESPQHLRIGMCAEPEIVQRRSQPVGRGAGRTASMKIKIIGGGPAGMYFAILMKQANAGHEITIYERNGPDDTFGWGVVFSGKTLRDSPPGRRSFAR